MRKQLGFLRVRPLTATEEMCCDKGCGKCDLIQVEEMRYRETNTITGEVLKYQFDLEERSACCGETVFIWDTVSETADEDPYVYIPVQEHNIGV